MTRTVLIAETDEHGVVAWLWRFGPNDRIAYPLDETPACIEDRGDFDVVGASKDAVLGWLAEKSRGRLERPR